MSLATGRAFGAAAARAPSRRSPRGAGVPSTSAARAVAASRSSPHRRPRAPTTHRALAPSSQAPADAFEEAEDRIIRLATTLNAYEHLAFTSKSTNMATYVYEQLALVPEEHRVLHGRAHRSRVSELLVHRRLLYKVKLAEREATGAMDISTDLEEYQERLERVAERFEAPGCVSDDAADEDDPDEYRRDEGSSSTSASASSSASAVPAARAGVQVFEGRAANVPGGPLIDRFQKVFYPSPTDPGTWHGRVCVKKPRAIERFLPLYFRTNDTLERFLKVPATGEDADLMLDYENPPYLEADMPPAMSRPGRMTPGAGTLATWWPVPKLPPPPFDTLVDYLRPLGPGVYTGRGWRGGEGGGVPHVHTLQEVRRRRERGRGGRVSEEDPRARGGELVSRFVRRLTLVKSGCRQRR